ncbi:MAG: HypC/HybG/HupF family hydrogenase formation chaperone [Anaerolineae bacterium]|nr:HypC/HybG/HupF family hydrogenase formation chaperone [Anaerolineae bacterium]
MCLAIPTQIQSIDGLMAEVEMGGVRRRVSLALTPEARVGDYVIVHTGFAISVLDEEEAQESLRLFAEMAALMEDEDGAAGEP